jgi:hypothetical protein
MRFACVLLFTVPWGCVVVTPPCSDGVLDGNESDVDCGGSCGATCADGQRCLGNADCRGGVCGGDGRCGVPTLPSSAGATTYHIDTASNIGVQIQPGVTAGYDILASPGGSFRIVWTGDGLTSGAKSNFTGTIWTTATIDSVAPGCSDGSCPLESNDFVSTATQVTGGYLVSFDTITSTGIDGFDFTVTAESSAQPVYFDLLIDGVRRADLVYFSSANQISSPQTDPFGLTSQ